MRKMARPHRQQHRYRKGLTMDFVQKSAIADKGALDALIVGVHEDGKMTPSAAAADALGGYITAAIKRGDCEGKPGSVLHLPGVGNYDRLLVVGLGKEAVSEKTLREAMIAGYKAVKATGATQITTALTEVVVAGRDAGWMAEQAATLAIDCAYVYDETKSVKNTRKPVSKVAIVAAKDVKAAAEAGLKCGKAIAGGMALTKDLGNLPGNICTPTYLAEAAKKLGKAHGLKVTVLDEKEMKKLGMNTLLSVSRGSEEPPRLVTMEYNGGKKGAAPLALVGKGVTFDTGGISIKPSAEMDEMKYDMCGAGTVLGVMKAIATLGLPVNVVGVIAAVENMPSGRATKPGDIVTSMSGQTVEILNTDAEGRLILCDALTYTERFKPAKVVDIATLTGAMVIALGGHTTGLFANDDDLAWELVKAGNACYDRAWHLPLFAEYDDMLKSNFADIPNITGGRAAGSITAAAFLGRFTKKFKWAHLDIAGTAWKSGAEKGATGRPVPLLTHWVAAHS
jgi:leucyl aminopeptidase